MFKVCTMLFFFILFFNPLSSLAKLDHSVDFENSSISFNYLIDRKIKYPIHQQIDGQWIVPKAENIWINKSFSKNGKNSIGFRLKPRESRIEVKVGDMKNNQIKYLSFSLFIPSDFQPPTHWNLFAQWWQGAPASPPIAFEFAPNSNPLKMQILTRNGSSKDFDMKVQYINTIQKEVWNDFIVKLKVDDKGGTNGILKIWKNGKVIVDYQGQLGYQDLYSHTNFRFGLYRSDNNNSLVDLYFDEVKIGDSYDAVKIVKASKLSAKENNSKKIIKIKTYKTKANLNLRTGPSTKYKVKTVIPKGKNLKYLRKRGSWVEVEYGNYTGWVSSKYII